MKINLVLLFGLIYFTGAVSAQNGKHLFVLSGQSNMVGLRPAESFLPILESEFGKEKVLIVKDAMGSQPIRRWYKAWKPLSGEVPSFQSDLYDSLMKKVNVALKDQQIETVTFIWMQGERDAREAHGEVYEQSLRGLYHQLSKDLNRQDINFIIGRLSDFDMTNSKYPHWTLIRDIQVKVGISNPRFSWVDSDDLNDGFDRNGKAIKNDLHMSAEGYKTLGKRFAEKALQLINNNTKN